MEEEVAITRNVIKVNSVWRNQLIKEFNVSDMTIYSALKDITKSALAKRIRTRAKEILEKEVKSIKI